MLTLNVQKLYEALDAKRTAVSCKHCNEELSWRAVARELGMPPSTFSRIARQQGMSADTLVRVLGWLGETDLAPYLSAVPAPAGQEGGTA